LLVAEARAGFGAAMSKGADGSRSAVTMAQKKSCGFVDGIFLSGEIVVTIRVNI